MMYTYPSVPEAGVAGGPSLMWECIREGTDDLRYLQTLEHFIRQAAARGQGARAQEAEAVLAAMRASPDMARLQETNRYIECRWDETITSPSGQRTVRGRFNVPNGWSLEDYDRWRQRIARHIVRLGSGS